MTDNATSRAQLVLEQTTTTYNPQAAYLAAVLSTWSYADEKQCRWVAERKSISRSFEVETASFSVRNAALPVDAQGYLITFRPEPASRVPGERPLGETAPGPERSLHVLVLRGTDPTEVLDFLTDALVHRHPWRKTHTPEYRAPSGDSEAEEWVHRGFFLSFDVCGRTSRSN